MSSLYRFSRQRFYIIIAVLLVLAVAVFARLIYLNTFNHRFLVTQGEYQSVHYRTIPAARGMIFDRNGVPLAVSAPIKDIILDPKTMLEYPSSIARLTRHAIFNLTSDQLLALLKKDPKSRYLLLMKDLPPPVADPILAERIPGVSAETHYNTYYPMGAPMAQLIGFTDNNNKGQSGLELQYDSTLADTEGLEAVRRNALGRVIAVLKIIKPAQNGHNITLSIDSRLQFLAYQAIADQVQKIHAEDGSVVITDPNTGEVLAAVSYPSFNPNDPIDRTGGKVKDRALTDQYEPGSTMKTFSLAAALLHGKYTPDTLVDTGTGSIVVGGHRLYDVHAKGIITVTNVLKYSSDVGTAKIVLSQPWNYTYDMIASAGFGKPSGVDFPGQSFGVIFPLNRLSTLEFANMAFGYHIATTTLQLARAYNAIANGGILYPLTLLKPTAPAVGTRIMPETIANEMLTMTHAVVEPGGSGVLANIKGYMVGGKTGTSNIAGPHGYSQSRYNAQFVGIVPLQHPRLVIVVHVTNPQNGYIYHQGAMSAAPVFATIAANAMRILGVPPTSS